MRAFSMNVPKRDQIDELLDQADDLTDNRVSYINQARVSFGETEITLDLYLVSSNPKETDTVAAQRVHRIVMPYPLAQEISSSLIEEPVTEQDDKVWSDLETLFATWDSRGVADDDIDDDWLDDLRSSWDDRLKDVYDTE
jgi:hypothetical protein